MSLLTDLRCLHNHQMMPCPVPACLCMTQWDSDTLWPATRGCLVLLCLTATWWLCWICPDGLILPRWWASSWWIRLRRWIEYARSSAQSWWVKDRIAWTCHCSDKHFWMDNYFVCLVWLFSPMWSPDWSPWQLWSSQLVCWHWKKKRHLSRRCLYCSEVEKAQEARSWSQRG